MRVLVLHNHYQQRGGEDESTALEVALLRSHGHEVREYVEHNDRLRDMPPVRAAGRAVWSRETYTRLRGVIREFRPDVVHVQNFFPLISPSAHYAARREGVPVVQTLRNYRLLCPNGVFFREGGVCEDCLGKAVPLPAVRHACYRGSMAATGAVAAMLTVHRALRTWLRVVDVYVALTEFSRRKFIEGGLPAEKVVVKPNFVHPDPGVRTGPGEYALFVGRLSEEKGVRTLLEAWRRAPGVPLRVVGDGPLLAEARRIVEEHGLGDRVRFMGRLPPGEVHELLHGARLLVFPSVWYETFGRVAIEAFACGVPVVAARLGAMAEVVEDGVNGLSFTPGDPEDLARTVRRAVGRPEELSAMGRRARESYERRYSAESNYRALLQIYRSAAGSPAPAPGEAEWPGGEGVLEGRCA